MNETMNFEESIKRLEEIVALLEAEKTPLDVALQLYEEGVALVRACHDKLQSAEQMIRMVTEDGSTAPMPAGEVAE